MRSRKRQNNPGAPKHTSVTVPEVCGLISTLEGATETAGQHANQGFIRNRDLKHLIILKQWQCSSVDLWQT